jgi:hypothetical protein
MKAILINTIGILVWIIIQHFVPPIYFITPIYIPLLFLLVGSSVAGYNNSNIYAGSCFVLLLTTDLLIKLYGKGVHDDVGRGLVELIFYITLVVVTIALILAGLKLGSQKRKLESEENSNPKSVRINIVFILLASILTVVLYRVLGQML